MTVPHPERAIGAAVLWLALFVASWWIPNTTWAVVLCGSAAIALTELCLDGLGLSALLSRKDDR